MIKIGTKPLISVIIPTYNRSEFLPEVIKLLLSQSFADWEAIIVDDSTIDSNNIIERYQDNRIRYIHRGVKSGVSAARNQGAALAMSSFIVFLDDDDQVTVNWLSDFALLIEQNKGAKVFFCGYEHTDTYSRKKVIVNPEEELWRVIFPGAFLIRKDFYNELGGYDENILYGENTELFFRIREQNPYYALTNHINYLYFPSMDGGSKNIKNIVESHRIVLRKHNLFFERNKKVKKLYLRMIGVSLMKLEKFSQARSYLWQSYMLDPMEFKSVLRLIVCYIPFLAKRIYFLK